MEPHLQPDPLSRSAHAEADSRARDEARAGLYLHVPFCARRCHYCAFSTGAHSAAAVERYLEAMSREAEYRAPGARDTVFTSVFVGGGTPSSLSARHFQRLWSTVTRHFTIAPDAEITLEANPESVRPALLEAWVAAGVNRLSMGAQSFDPEELSGLGRIHDAARPAAAFQEARAFGIRRLSLDLMFGFPGHGGATWDRTIDAALALESEHLSAYCFIPESGTPLGDQALRDPASCPDADAQADAYALLVQRVEAAGLGCYETSNFCRPGGQVRQHLVYWLRRPYVALGPSAHGCFGGVRYGNRHALNDWAEALERGMGPEETVEPESDRSIAQEIVMLGLRLGAGLQPRDHPPATWRGVRAHYGRALDAAVAAGRLESAGHGWRIAPRHRFVADDIIAWIEARAASRVDTAARGFIPLSACPTAPSQVT